MNEFWVIFFYGPPARWVVVFENMELNGSFGSVGAAISAGMRMAGHPECDWASEGFYGGFHYVYDPQNSEVVHDAP